MHAGRRVKPIVKQKLFALIITCTICYVGIKTPVESAPTHELENWFFAQSESKRYIRDLIFF